MAIVARGHTDDRPFARTIFAIGAKRFSGDLIVEHAGKRYTVGWRDGEIIAAESASPHDAPGRIALTAGLVSSSHLGEALRAQTAAPARDAIEVLASVARLTAEQVETVRRRTLAHRAVRVFALESASFVLDDSSRLTPEEVAPIDARWAVYNGLRAHYNEARLLRELASMAGNSSTFVLTDSGRAALGSFGFGELEKPVLARLAQPVSIVALAEEHPALDRRALGAILYALAATGSVSISEGTAGDAAARGRTPSLAPLGRGSASTQIPTVIAAASVAAAPTAPPRRRPGSSSPPMKKDSTRSSSTQIALRAGGSAPRAGSVGHAHSSSVRVPVAGTTGSASGSIPIPTPSHGQSSNSRIAVRSGAGASMAGQVRVVIKNGLDKMTAGADHFSLLGLPQTATAEQVRATYFDLARQLHPDRIRALQLDELGKDAQRLFAQINTAFAILNHPKRREEYAAILRAGGERVVKAKAAEAETKALRLLAAEDAFRRGEMALRRDLHADALAAFKQAVELNPEEGEHHAGLAWSTWCLAEDKTKIALEVRRGLDRAMELAPRSALPYLYRGRVAKHEGKIDFALQCFEQVLDIEPSNIDAASEKRLLASRRSKKDSKDGLFGRFRKG